MDSKSIDNISDESDFSRKKAKINFFDYAAQPNLVARVTRVKKVDEEKNSSDENVSVKRTSKRTQKVESKLGKRETPAISIFPVRNNKIAKIGAAAASIFAVSIALFGSQQDATDLSSQSQNELTFGHGFGGRNLLSIPPENQIEFS